MESTKKWRHTKLGKDGFWYKDIPYLKAILEINNDMKCQCIVPQIENRYWKKGTVITTVPPIEGLTILKNQDKPKEI